MSAFRILLATLFVALLGYTSVVIANHGLGLLPVFFGDMADFGWPGQFNADFTCMLTLSGLWVAWRHHFSPAGIALGLCALFGGALFLSAFLLVTSFQSRGDTKVLLLGPMRAAA